MPVPQKNKYKEITFMQELDYSIARTGGNFKNNMTPREAVEILERFDKNLSKGKFLRCTGVSTAIETLSSFVKRQDAEKIT